MSRWQNTDLNLSGCLLFKSTIFVVCFKKFTIKVEYHFRKITQNCLYTLGAFREQRTTVWGRYWDNNRWQRENSCFLGWVSNQRRWTQWKGDEAKAGKDTIRGYPAPSHQLLSPGPAISTWAVQGACMCTHGHVGVQLWGAVAKAWGRH